MRLHGTCWTISIHAASHAGLCLPKPQTALKGSSLKCCAFVIFCATLIFSGMFLPSGSDCLVCQTVARILVVIPNFLKILASRQSTGKAPSAPHCRGSLSTRSCGGSWAAVPHHRLGTANFCTAVHQEFMHPRSCIHASPACHDNILKLQPCQECVIDRLMGCKNLGNVSSMEPGAKAFESETGQSQPWTRANLALAKVATRVYCDVEEWRADRLSLPGGELLLSGTADHTARKE